MKDACAPATEKSSGTVVVRMLAATFAALVMLCLYSTTAFSQCTLGGKVYSAITSGNWDDTMTWDTGKIPNDSGTSVCITNGTSTVTLDTGPGFRIDNLQLAKGNTLAIDPNGALIVFGTQVINDGQIALTAGVGANALLQFEGSVTLSGGGTLTMSGGNGAVIQDVGLGAIMTNQITIQGAGSMGGSPLNNSGTINANSSGQTLIVGVSDITNTNLLEATKGGVLQLSFDAINNAGGNITANGGTVQLSGSNGNTSIQGGTLNTLNGGTLGTLAGSTATLDGSTGAGAVTINGTYTADSRSKTFLRGTITNNGNIQVNGGSGVGFDTMLIINSVNLTLQGGGTVTLSATAGGGNASIVGGTSLTNVNNTIQGAGVIGTGLVNEADGTIIANSMGQTFFINNGGTVTNRGTFQVDGGSALVLQDVSLTNFAGNTLTDGTYNVYGTLVSTGTLQIDSLGKTGGEIVNNAATILLDGTNSNFVDAAGKDALSNFSNNTAAGTFTIQNGRNFTSPGDFANAGTVNVGAGSTFTTGGNYNQNGGSTTVDGALVVGGGALGPGGGGQLNINGGTLMANGGSITGNVMLAGILSPGDALGGAGALHIIGNYTQTATGIFNLGIGGLGAGTQFSLLTATGTSSLLGTLNVSLLGGFFPKVGNTFTFMTASGGVSGVFSNVNGLNIGNGEEFVVVYDPNDVKIETEQFGPLAEPGTVLILVPGLLSMAYGLRRKLCRP